MAALTAVRDPQWVPDQTTLTPLGVAASTSLYAGGLVCRNASGYAVAAAAGAGRVYGVAQETVDNSSGANAAKTVKCSQGIYHFGNSGTNPATIADLMRPVYVEDDQTITREQNAAGTLPVAGILVKVDATEGCAVLVGMLAQGSGSLVAIQAQVPDISTAGTYYLTSPVSGTIERIVGTLQAAITGTSAVVTTNIGGTPVTGGALTVAAGAAGTGDAATPTGANTLAVGDAVTVVTGGESTNTALLDVILLVRVD